MAVRVDTTRPSDGHDRCLRREGGISGESLEETLTEETIFIVTEKDCVRENLVGREDGD